MMRLKKSGIFKVILSNLSIIVAIVMCISFLNSQAKAQLLSASLLDLRTKIKKHKWSFHPGDSPVVSVDNKKLKIDKNIVLTDLEEYGDEQPARGESLIFAWADSELKGIHSRGWIDDIQIQLAWTRYRDSSGNRIFKDYNEYIREYKGYGWYRTTFSINKNDFVKKFKSYNLILRLGKIGQADAVYLNGHYIGGTGLLPDTPREYELADKELFYDKIRYYKLPREFLKHDASNVIAVRVYAKYNIAPGLSHGKYYITSQRKIERSKFWDSFKKTFVIVLSVLLGMFYLYWHSLFKEDGKASIYFAIASFAMAINTFMQSQVVYSIWRNAFWIKKLEFVSFIIFVHLLLEFFVNFTKVDSKFIRIINRFWDFLGLAAVIAVILMPTMITARQFMFIWGAAPSFVLIYMIYIFIKGSKIPSITSAIIGFTVMVVILINDVLVGFQFRWVLWEFSLKDYAFAFFGIMIAVSIVSNMKKSKELIEKQKAEKERLSKYFSPDVVDTILDGKIQLGGEEKTVVTLFADIVGFTSYSETKTPAQVVRRLNEMFTRLSSVIFSYEATLDKYIGDCIMAFWGAPRPTPMDAYKAVSCGLNMQRAVDQINTELPEGETPFNLRIGINQGPSIVGNIGSEQRMDYTVIGDAVNTASRIESSGIPGKIAISESVFNAAGGDQYIQYSETREITVKGKTEPLKIYIVEDLNERSEKE